MQSRRDQVQAHMFVMSRLSSGILRGEPDSPDTPIGRTTRGTALGLLIGVAIGAGFGVYGLISPGGATGWQKPGTLVLVKETGARYIFANGVLHPVLNETSAKLLAGDKMTVDEVGQASLVGAARGSAVGIVGAPDGLPPAAELRSSVWLACAVPQQGGSAGTTAPQLTLVVGPSQEGRQLTGDQSIVVETPDQTLHLLWRGQRYRLGGDGSALRALGLGAAAPVPVPASFLNSFTAGPDLVAPDVHGRGSTGPTLAGRPTRVGQLFSGSGADRYVLTDTGLVQLGPTEFALLQGDVGTQKEAYGGAAVSVEQIGPADLAAHSAPSSTVAQWAAAALPAQPPTSLTVSQGQGVCADMHLSGNSPVTSVSVVDAAALGGQPPAVQPGVLPSCTPADRIAVRPGGGALVRSLSGGGTGTTAYLVTDTGVKYPLPSAAAAKQLGYGDTTPTAVPGQLLGMLPSGPPLDPALLSSGGVVTPPDTKAPCGS